ncbi:unnamed protein product [Calicophoron daubneyi]|uniref:N-acetylglucosaminylphosphatidylinositol deacetylase n=1 Tax=Calicophoron daubneyi TaxID=300641 RepID=A0AAV2TE29_CALDB
MEGYNSPQIERKYLIPLAEKFIADPSNEVSSVDEFADFVIKNGTTPCKRVNFRAWRKDAYKALRFANAQVLLSPAVNPDSAVKKTDGPIFSSDGSKPHILVKNSSHKRLRAALDASVAENCIAQLPSVRLSEIESTTPLELRRQLKYFIRSHVWNTINLPVWPSILISGPPFCGKSTLLEATCGSLGIKMITISVGTVPSNLRSWTDIFKQAKSSAPCVLHLDDIEGMEKHSAPAGTFRLTCLLKSQLLKDLIGSGVAVVGETRCLLASLPQSVIDLFTQRITFGMLCEEHRLNLFRRYLAEEKHEEFVITKPGAIRGGEVMELTEGLTCLELARRTPGYEVGDIIRFVAQLHMVALANSDSDDVTMKPPNVFLSDGADEIEKEMDLNPVIAITREMVDECLATVIPAVKNTNEFVTIPDVTWADVGGLSATKLELYNRFMLLVDDWERAKTLHRRSGGVLLEGPPGCGKTLVAKALSNQAGLNFLSVKGPEVLNKFQGESERRVREIFERARACQPCLIFFDEIDAICPRRDSDESSGSRVSLVNQLLVELDGIDKHRSARVFVVGATNRKDMIDPAVLRPGRLGLHLVISPPANAAERASVLSACTRAATTPLIEGGVASLEELAADPRTDNMSGADLDNLLELAKQYAQIDKQDFVWRKHLFAALSELSNQRSSVLDSCRSNVQISGLNCAWNLEVAGMDGYSSLFIGALLLVIGLVRLAYLRIHSMPKRANKIPSPVLLVVAHPDDEAMFFAPILLNLKAANIPVDLLCLSNGNYDGVGLTRSKELDKSAKHFGVRHLKMINLTELPDDPKCNWPLDLIAQIASSAVEEFHSQSVITFDQSGVSGHLNHCAIAKALEQARKRKLIPSLFCLQSLPLYRKRLNTTSVSAAALLNRTFMSQDVLQMALEVGSFGSVEATTDLKQRCVIRELNRLQIYDNAQMPKTPSGHTASNLLAPAWSVKVPGIFISTRFMPSTSGLPGVSQGVFLVFPKPSDRHSLNTSVLPNISSRPGCSCSNVTYLAVKRSNIALTAESIPQLTAGTPSHYLESNKSERQCTDWFVLLLIRDEFD